MKTIAIYKKDTKIVLYEGLFPSYKACIENAVRERINLAYADMRYKNLSNASLDGANLPYADFTHANLTGVNMSEARLTHCDFTGASFYNACLADSDLRHCNFNSASFGATNIWGSDISESCFSTLSCFTLDFDLVKNMRNCTFKNTNGALSRMSYPPLLIKGRQMQPIILLDEHIKVAGLTIPYIPQTAEFRLFSNNLQK